MAVSARFALPHGDIQSQLVGLKGATTAKPVKVLLDGEEEVVYIDPERGPKAGPGENDHMTLFLPSVPFDCPKQAGPGGHDNIKKGWDGMSGTEKEVWIILTAKKIRAKRRLQQAREEKARSGA
mmetsp:Transcript_7484/g.20284  ORF Transcript_7484/g.20284 Transcript_7484/m.20284 type:complete len:124 (-) Transcript_7484:28-399(-)|eukprot:UN3054